MMEYAREYRGTARGYALARRRISILGKYFSGLPHRGFFIRDTSRDLGVGEVSILGIVKSDTPRITFGISPLRNSICFERERNGQREAERRPAIKECDRRQKRGNNRAM